jgi:hypothetical protein
MDALCIKGWSKMWSKIQAPPTRRQRQPKLKINVRVWNTKDR